jgi:Na+-driven multidrug efflux pump
MAFGYPFIGMAIILAAAFQGLGRGMPSLVITLSRAILVALPLSYGLAVIAGMGITGVWIGLLVSAFVSSIISFIWIESILRGLCAKCE